MVNEHGRLQLANEAARRAVETAWFMPDPVGTAVPTADLGPLFEALVATGRRIAVATTDDRAPTEATLRALDLLAVQELFASGQRLVTLIGPAGTGTTRWVRTFVPTWAPCSLITELKPAMRCTKLSRYSCRMAGRLT